VVYLIVMLKGCGMLRHAFLPVFVLLFALYATVPAGATSFANVNMYGYPMLIGPGGSGAPGVPGASYTVTDPGIAGLADVTSRYGIISASSVSQPQTSGYNFGYLGSDTGGIALGVNFGWPTATHDAATTAYAKDVAYEAALDNAAIAFPGAGVGSLGVAFPKLTSNKADVKYMESVRFELSTESDTMPLGGWFSPLGLGLGYGSVGISGGLGLSSSQLGLPSFYG
jgi:hypothetical protein